MKRTWLILLVIFVLCHGLFAATWSKWNNITVGTTGGNISKWNNGTIGTTVGNIGAWNGLVSPGGGGGGPTIGTSVAGYSNNTTSPLVLTFSPSRASGDSIVVSGEVENGSTADVSSMIMNDGSSTACTQDLNVDIHGGTASHLYFYHCALPATVSTVTITFSGSGSAGSWVGTPFTPASAGAITVDVKDTVGLNGTGGTCTSNALTTTNANDIVFGFCYMNVNLKTLTASAGWTLTGQINTGDTAGGIYKVLSGTTTLTPSLTYTGTSDFFAGIGIAYKLP